MPAGARHSPWNPWRAFGHPESSSINPQRTLERRAALGHSTAVFGNGVCRLWTASGGGDLQGFGCTRLCEYRNNHGGAITACIGLDGRAAAPKPIYKAAQFLSRPYNHPNMQYQLSRSQCTGRRHRTALPAAAARWTRQQWRARAAPPARQDVPVAGKQLLYEAIALDMVRSLTCAVAGSTRTPLAL